MKNIKLLKGLLPTTIALGCIPLATITTTSCSNKDNSADFVSFDKVQKEIKGKYDEALGTTATALLPGFEIKDGYSIDDLVVSIDNPEFDGVISVAPVQDEGNSFHLVILFQSTTPLITQSAKFDITFSHKQFKGHTQTLTGMYVDFTYYDIQIYRSDFAKTQVLVTKQQKTSFITKGIFGAYTTLGEEIEDLSDFYIDVYTDSETIEASAEVVPLYNSLFAIQLSLSGYQEKDALTITYTVKNRQIPFWYQDFTFVLGITQDESKYFDFDYSTEGGVNTATLTSCNVQDSTVEIPDEVEKDGVKYTVTGIGPSAFAYHYNLRKLIIPEHVTDISSVKASFVGTYIESIVVDEKNTQYTSKANGQQCDCIMPKPSEGEPTEILIGCAGTKIETCITKIDQGAFTECFGLESITVPANVTTIGTNAFGGCINLKNVELKGVKAIETNAFEYCISLNNISLGVAQTLKMHALSHCYSLKEVNIPASLTEISTNAFNFNRNIERFTVDTNNTRYTSKDVNGKECYGIMFRPSSNNAAPTTYIRAGKQSVVPDGITTLYNSCFEGLYNIAKIDLPASVVNVCAYAFSHCNQLAIINTAQFTSIEAYAFANCPKLTTVALNDELTLIPESAFSGCRVLKTVTGGAKVETIGQSAFNGCSYLAELPVMPKLKAIVANAFNSNKSLKSIDLSNSSELFIGASAFENCNILSEVKLPTTANALTLGEKVFRGCTALKNIDLTGIKDEIPSEAFYNDTALNIVTLPTTNISIGVNAFKECTSLSGIDLSKVTVIGDNAFVNCSALLGISLKSATSIGINAFQGCSKLYIVALDENTTLTLISNNVFQGCTELEEIVIPENITRIAIGAFFNSGLKRATFADQTHTWTKGEGGEEITIETIKNPESMAQLLLTETTTLVKKTA